MPNTAPATAAYPLAPEETREMAAKATRAVAGLSVTLLLASLGTSIANVSLPTLGTAFGASFQAVQWVVLAYLVAVTSVVVGAGRIGDLFGRRRVLLGGIATFAVASILCGSAPSLGILILGRALQGLAAAVMMALSLALVSEILPKEKTGRAMGLLGTMSAVGTAIGPSLGGVLIGLAGWRAIFLVNLPLAIVAYGLAQRSLPADKTDTRDPRARFDGVGTLLLTVALAAYAVAMTLGKGHPGPANFTLLAIAITAAAAFLYAEGKVASPLIDPRLLRDPVLRGRLLTSGVVATVMMTTLVVGPFYLTLALGLGTTAAGLALSVGPTLAALAGVPSGRLVERMGSRGVTLLGLAGIGGGSLALALLPAALGLAGYLGPIVVMTISYSLFQTANNTAVMRDVPTARRGVTSGMLNLSRNLGLVTGASVMTAIFALATGRAPIATAAPAAVAGGMHVTFAVSGILTIAALAVALRDRAETKE